MTATTITDEFLKWSESGGHRIGQIAIRRPSDRSWELRHVEDLGREALALHMRPEAARHLANLNDDGKYRPLKTTPDLAHGWRLVLRDVAEVRRALDYLYPAMVGVWHSHVRVEVRAAPLRETLGRQTGMYRITQKTTDEQARETTDRFCAGCLKHRLWEIDGPNPDPLDPEPGELPLICQEACNLLIAELRKVVKSGKAPEPATLA